tara:strand:+ start:386 stop:550 length:165 start_codon:yes stop_codon:yes gene_type:complete
MNNEDKDKKKENFDSLETIVSVASPSEKVLCKHCLRTANNEIRCLGMCIADNDY